MSMAIKRGIVVALGLALQILLFLFTYLYLGKYSSILNSIYQILGFLIVLWLVRSSRSYSYVLPWLIIILLFPIVGSLLYVIIGYNMRKSKTLKKILISENKMKKYLAQNEKVKNEIKDNSRINYITDYVGYPVTINNDVSYYPLGELAFDEMIKELEKAQKFIFFEYFIVAHGKMWGTVLEILKEKAKEGVDVRVMYDDLGCMSTLKPSYPKELEKYGMYCI